MGPHVSAFDCIAEIHACVPCFALSIHTGSRFSASQRSHGGRDASMWVCPVYRAPFRHRMHARYLRACPCGVALSATHPAIPPLFCRPIPWPLGMSLYPLQKQPQARQHCPTRQPPAHPTIVHRVRELWHFSQPSSVPVCSVMHESFCVVPSVFLPLVCVHPQTNAMEGGVRGDSRGRYQVSVCLRARRRQFGLCVL
jgi:hypothetical protein